MQALSFTVVTVKLIIWLPMERVSEEMATIEDKETIKDASEATNQARSDAEPNEIFKRMVINDKKQNQRLSSSLSKSNGTASFPSGAGTNGQHRRTKVRFIVCTLGLFALSVSQMSRMILNQTIKDMVHPSMHKRGAQSVSSDGSCPWPQENTSRSNEINNSLISTTPMYSTTADPTSEPYRPTEDPIIEFLGDEEDGERPDSELASWGEQTTTGSLSIDGLITGSPVDNSFVDVETIYEDKFYWTMKQQSYLLGGFFYGYSFFMIPGGRLAEMYGAKYVVLLSIAGSGIINMATPWMARNSFVLLVISRAVMGVMQSGVFPACYALFSKWLTPTETSLFAPLIKTNLRLGMFFGSILPGLLADWPSVYYFTGIVSGILSLVWLMIASSGPEGNSWVSESELAHINRKKRKPRPPQQDAIELTTRTADNEKQSTQVKVKIKQLKAKTPWTKILTNPSVIGLILVKVTFNYAVDFFSILIPSYLAYVHHASKETVSFITTLMFSLQIALLVFIGWLAKVMILKKPFGLSKTAIRKIFQGLANWGMALSLILITFNDCRIVYVAVLLQLMSLLSMFTAGGETMLPYDLSDQYPATIMAIANSIANFSGVTTTYLAGLILGDKSGSYERWNVLMYLIAGANLLGGLAFVLLVKAEPIDFEKSRRNDIEQQQPTQNNKPQVDKAQVAEESSSSVEQKKTAE